MSLFLFAFNLLFLRKTIENKILSMFVDPRRYTIQLWLEVHTYMVNEASLYLDSNPSW